jgi:tetratricopeptide (TPR) repeat protein
MLGVGRVDANVGASFLSDDRSARLTAAEATIGRVLSRRPDDPLAHEILGGILHQTKRPDQAIAELERALVLDSNLAAAHGGIGLAKIFIGRAVETEGHVNEALRLSPRDSFAWIWLQYAGGAKSALGADEEAVARLRRSIELNRNSPIVHFFLAAALANLGKLDVAQAEARFALALDPAFTIQRFRAGQENDNAIFLAGKARILEGMSKAGVPHG